MLKCYLAKLLAERNLQIADAAKATGLSKTILRKLCNDELPYLDLIIVDKLCNYLKCQVKDLYELIKN